MAMLPLPRNHLPATNAFLVNHPSHPCQNAGGIFLKFMRKILLTAVVSAVLSMVLPLRSNSQQLPGWYMLGPRHYTSVTLQSAGTIVVTCNNGYIYRSTDRGHHWQPIRVNDSLRFNDIAFLDSLHGALIDDLNAVLITSDGGASWTAHRSPIVGPLSIAYPKFGSIIVTDGLGGVHKSDDLGASWKSQRFAEAARIRDVVFRDSDHGWIVGDSGIYATTIDGGDTWVRADFPNDFLQSISWSETGQGFIGAAYGCYLSYDNGLHWIKRERVGPPIQAGFFISDSDVIAFTETGTVLVSSDSGKNFTNKEISQSWPFGHVEDALFSKETGGIAVGEDGSLSRSDDGKSWTTVEWFPIRMKIAMDIVTDSRGTSWHIIERKSFRNVLLTSNDSGRSWVPHAIPPTFFQDLHFVSRDSGYIFYESNLGQTYETTDGGQTWNPAAIREQSPPRDWFTNDMKISPEGFGVLVGDQWIYTTVDHGAHWSYKHFPADTTTPFLATRPYKSLFISCSISGPTDAEAVYATIDTLPGKFKTRTYHSTVVATTNKGVNWSPLKNCPQTPQARCVYRKGDHAYFIGCLGGVVWRSLDAGQTWDSLDFGMDTAMTAIGFLNDSVGFIGTPVGLVFITTDGGFTWQRHDIPFKDDGWGAPAVTEFKFPTENTVFALTHRGLFSLTMTNESRSTTIRDGDIRPFMIVDLFPNPAKNFLHVRLQGLWSAPESAVQAQLEDVLGRTLLDLSANARRGSDGKISSFDVDVSGLPPGVYAVRFALRGISRSRFFVVER